MTNEVVNISNYVEQYNNQPLDILDQEIVNVYLKVKNN